MPIERNYAEEGQVVTFHAAPAQLVGVEFVGTKSDRPDMVVLNLRFVELGVERKVILTIGCIKSLHDCIQGAVALLPGLFDGLK